MTLDLKNEVEESRIDDWITANNINETVEWLSLDNGILNAIKYFGYDGDTLKNNKNFLYRCASCFTLFNKKIYFLKKCASNMITRVSMKIENGKVQLFLKRGFKHIKRKLKDKFGNVLLSADQK